MDKDVSNECTTILTHFHSISLCFSLLLLENLPPPSESKFISGINIQLIALTCHPEPHEDREITKLAFTTEVR